MSQDGVQVPVPSRRPGRTSWIVAALAATVVVLAVVVHTPPVRRAALGYAIAAVQRQYGVRIDAARLDYNLPALTVGLSELRLFAGAADVPFFEARYVGAALSRSGLLGDISFRGIAISDGRVRIVRRADGSTNLPSSTTTPDGEPPPLRVGELSIPRLAIEVHDEVSDVDVDVPSLELRLTAREGRVALRQLAQIRVADHMTRVSQLAGEATFDGRTVSLNSLSVRTDEASFRTDGTITLIASRPSMELLASGTADIARLARWGMSDAGLPAGEVAYQIHAFGALDDPVMDVRFQAPQVTWQGLSATNLTATARLDPLQVHIAHFETTVEGGRVGGAAAIPLDASKNGGMKIAWDGIDAARLAARLGNALPIAPAGTLAGELEIEGPLAAAQEWTASVTLQVRSSRAGRRQLAVPGGATLRLVHGRWSVRARHRLGGAVPVIVALDGRLASRELRRSTVKGTIQVTPSDLPLALRVLRASGLLDVSPEQVPEGRVEASVRVAGTFAEPAIDASARLNNVAGRQFSVATVDVEAAGTPDRLAFTAIARDGAVAGQALDVRSRGRLRDGRLEIDELTAAQHGASGELNAAGNYDLADGRFLVNAHVAKWQVSPTTDLPVAGRVEARFQGRGTVSDPHGEGAVTVSDLAWREVNGGSLDAKIRLDGGRATVDARSPEFATTAHARMRLAAPYAMVADLATDNLDLARVLDHIDAPAPLIGRVSMRARAEGPLEAWRTGRADVTVTSFEAKAGDLPIRLTEPAAVSYADARIRVDRFEGAAGDTRISGAGTLPLRTASAADGARDALLLTVIGDVGEILRASRALGVATSPITGGDGPITLLGRATGALESPILAGDLEVGPGSLALGDLPPVSGLRVRAHLERDWLGLHEAAGVYQGAQLTATGRAPLSLFLTTAPAASNGGLSLRARATGLSPDALEGLVDAATRAQLEGGVDLSLDLDATSLDVEALTGELRLDRLDLRIADLPVTQRLPTRVAIADGFARVAAWDWAGQGATLAVRGQVGLRNRLAAILADGDIDLRMITPFVRTAGITTAGRMVPRLSITGSIDDPRIDGDLTIGDGQVRLVEPRVIVSDLAARVVLSRTTATIVSLAGSVNGGALNGGGRIEYGRASELSGVLTADLRDVALEYPAGLRSELNAALELELEADRSGAGASGRLAGTVNAIRGAYREPMAMVTGMLAGLRARQLSSPTASSLLERLAVDLRLLTDDDIIVDNNYGRVQLGADLRVMGTAAAPVLSGRAELREGGQLFIGRNVYTITSGTIDFANAVTIDPELNIEATTRAAGKEIVVRLTGTPAALTPELSSPSNPELGQADLTSLLLTGRELDELAPDDAAFIGAQVVGNLSGEVLGFAGRAIGLDSLRLGGVGDASRRDPTAIATEVDPTSRLTFNKSIRSDVEITYSQSLRNAGAQTWIVDYLPSRQLQLRLVSDDEDLRSYGLRHDVAVGGTQRAARPEQAGPGRTRVSEVVLQGELAFPEPRLRQLLRLQPGDSFDFAEWQTDRDRLEQFYRQQRRLAARVGTERMEAAEGVQLTYRVVAGPETLIVVTGAELGADVMARLERAWADSVFDEFLVDEAIQAVTSALAAEGYLRAKVAARLLRDGETERLEVTIARGERVSRIDVRLDVSERTMTDDVNRWLDDRRLTAVAATDPALVQRELVSDLRSRGFLGARVTVGAPLFEAQAAIVPVTVDAGSASVLGRVTFDGATDLQPGTLAEAVALDEGVPYDSAAVQSARERLAALLRREGFPAPAVDAREMPRGRVVDVAFVMSTGERQVIEEVAIAGNRAIGRDVIVRTLALSAGAPLRTDDLLGARRRLFGTGLFRRVDVTTEPLNETAAGAATHARPGQRAARVRVVVEEWPAFRLRYGVRVNEERSAADAGRRDLAPGASADVTRRTLFGRAVTLGGAAEYQRRERRARAFVSMPTLMGLPITSSLVGEGSQTDFADSSLVTARQGVSWEQRTRVARTVTLSYAYRFDRDHTFDTKPDPSFPAFDITVNIARLTGAAARDTRDDPSDTVRGSLLSSTLEYAPEALGSDIRFVRYVTQAYAFRPWRAVVFASAGRFGVVAPLAGQELIPSERFFAGGSRTVRGVEEDGLGGRDFLGSPIGGQALLVLNQEVRFPIYRWLRGVGFVDAGNVFRSAGKVNLSDVAGSIGYGFRLATPIGILRADYGWRLWPSPAASSGRWSLGLGQVF